MTDILDLLEDWGCDIDEGLTRLGGDEDFYRMLVTEFSQENGMNGLLKAMDRGDYSQAFEMAHGLKGDTGNLSLTPLYEAVCKLVEDLRSACKGQDPQDNLEEDYSNVQEEYARFIKIAASI